MSAQALSARRRGFPSPEWIVFVLAIALAGATLVFAGAVLFEVIDHERISEVPPNSSQVLTAIFSGIIGIVGSFVGYNVGRHPDPPPIDQTTEAP